MPLTVEFKYDRTNYLNGCLTYYRQVCSSVFLQDVEFQAEDHRTLNGTANRRPKHSKQRGSFCPQPELRTGSEHIPALFLQGVYADADCGLYATRRGDQRVDCNAQTWVSEIACQYGRIDPY